MFCEHEFIHGWDEFGCEIASFLTDRDLRSFFARMLVSLSINNLNAEMYTYLNG